MKRRQTFFLFSGILVIWISMLILPISAKAQQRTIKTPLQTSALKDQVTIKSINPNPVNLTAGGQEVAVTLTGTNLNQITGVQVIEQGKLIITFEIKTDAVSATSGTVNLKAKADAKPGSYQLRIIAGAQIIEIPTSVVSLQVKSGVRMGTTARKETFTAQVQKDKTLPTVQKDKTLTTAKDVISRSRVLRTSEFDSFVTNELRDAYYYAVACAGRYADRKTVISIQNIPYFKEGHLSRLDYEFTDGEKERNTRTVGGTMGTHKERRSAIRACVNLGRSFQWRGFIAEGKLTIRMQFHNEMTNTRAMHQRTYVGVWADMWDWKDGQADAAIQDYIYLAPSIEVLLQAIVNNGKVSYGDVQARWFYVEDKGFLGGGSFRLPDMERSKILHYKDQQMTEMLQRAKMLFDDSTTRNYLTNALTSFVKSGEFANRTIIGISGVSDHLTISFE